MKTTRILYWVFTGLLAAMILSSAVPNLISNDQSKEIFKHLQYPMYIIPFLGLAKLLASIVILIPGLKLLKEWAYAGIFFDLTGATYSGLAVGDPVLMWWPMLLFFVMLGLSYYYYHKKLSQEGQRT